MEDPFHYDPNELPLPQIQYRFNERLLAVSRTQRPVAFTDIGDLNGPGNKPAQAAATPVRPLRCSTVDFCEYWLYPVRVLCGCCAAG